MDDHEFFSKLFRNEADFSYQERTGFAELCCGTKTGSLNRSQRVVFDFVISEVGKSKQCLLFIDARGGFFKTYIRNANLAAARTTHENVVLAPATSGIAARQLNGGRTFRSRMRAIFRDKETICLSITFCAVITGKRCYAVCIYCLG